MKKFLVLLVLLALCLCCTLCAFGEELRVPATSDAVLAELPIALPPMPTVTEGGDPYSYVYRGLEQWPIKNVEMYKSGVYWFKPSTAELLPLKGREDEPFTVIYSEKDYNRAYLDVDFGNPDVEYSCIIVEDGEVIGRFSFKKGSIEVNKDGNVINYRGGITDASTQADYGTDGLLSGFTYNKDDLNIIYSLDGSIESIVFENNEDGYSYYTPKAGWYGKDGEACEPPKGFTVDNCPTAVYYPQEAADKLKEKLTSVGDALPPLPPESNDFSEITDMSNFPPAPVIKTETDDKGNVTITVTGLDAWGFVTGIHTEFISAISAGVKSGMGAKNTWIIPAEFYSEWALSVGTLSLESPNPERGGRILIEADSYMMNIDIGEGASYTVILGDKPYISECSYAIDGRYNLVYFTSDGTIEDYISYQELTLDGTRVKCYYTIEGEVDRYRLYSDEPPMSCGYDPQGNVTIIYFYDKEIVYDLEADEWCDYSTGEYVVCEAPEGIDITPFMTLDISRLTPQE